MKCTLISMIVFLVLGLCLLPSTTRAQQQLVIKSLAERKVAELPAGELYWRIENFTTLAQAQSAAGPWGLVADSVGKDWLFTLGPAGGSSAGGTKVAEVGPISGCGTAVSPSAQRSQRFSGQHHACTHASGFRSILRLGRRAKHPHSPWSNACQGWSVRSG